MVGAKYVVEEHAINARNVPLQYILKTALQHFINKQYTMVCIFQIS